MRGGGIFQPALPHARAMLENGDWIHVFPEGGISQPPDPTRRFKWGISRLILETRILPIVIPIYLSGFDQVMPESRASPRFIPRPGADIAVHFGAPLDSARLLAYRDALRGAPLPPRPNAPYGHIYPEAPAALRDGDDPHTAAVRSHLAAYLRSELLQLGSSST